MLSHDKHLCAELHTSGNVAAAMCHQLLCRHRRRTKVAGFSQRGWHMAQIFSPQYSVNAMRWVRSLLFLALALATPLIALAADGDPGNLVHWRRGLDSSAQPDQAWLQNAKALGYDMVINLAPPEYETAVETEGALLAKTGVVYVNIPVAWTSPTIEDFQLFSNVLKAAGNKNVLVHCQVNLRGSSFTFLYRVIHEGAPLNDSLAKLTGVWAPNPTWKKFVETVLAANGRRIEVF